ncbi:hypothetical protein [Parabacteroides sp. PF5-9]|uniref:TolB family protein n=1 Tax=Parabacteroides sp. PF5-9 TaxID=1742404 RepID=UPI002475B21A|nr:hypothetical protein [Parabacteroides sp. PF5-9]MDH6356763.1 hypothetical protein [Parabacteroides sp. PF5-9]
MNRVFFLLIVSLWGCLSCSQSIPDSRPVDKEPEIFPPYTEVTIPPNISPLNFELKSTHDEAYAVFTANNETLQVKAKKGQFHIPPKSWEKLLLAATGQSIDITIYAKENDWIRYNAFQMHVAKEPIDSHLAYRLIEPGYELWYRMGLYQRNLESYQESAIIENRISDNNCMNCHSFRMQEPHNMVFHMRGESAGTMLIKDNKIEKLNTRTEQTMSALVFPAWHPSGRYIAFSVNENFQSFHRKNKNRIEVYDSNSDIVIYDTETHELFTTEALFAEGAYETCPAFSPDGKTLYYNSAKARQMPDEFDELKYSLCAISFDADTRSFGHEVDTLYNAEIGGLSASFPRVSPNGKYLLYALSDHGYFLIWHKDADLHMINLETGEHYPLEAANSDDTESYHSWSSNSHWIVFSSRCIDGLYTRPHFAYIDKNGQAAKPFLLPQKDTKYYDRFMKSYNIPEFITGKVETRSRELASTAQNEPGMNITFAGKDF